MRIYWRDDARERKASDVPLVSEVLTLLERNPYASFVEMDINQLDKWRPFDRARALETLGRGREPSLGLRTDTVPATYASLAAGQGVLAATLSPADTDVQGTPARQTLLAFIREMATALPLFYIAYADANYNRGAFREAQNLPEIGDPFGSCLQWYYLLSPRCYSEHYTREALLGAPAWSVQEWDNGWIELISFEDPLSYATPKSQQRIIEMTRYLDSHRRA